MEVIIDYIKYDVTGATAEVSGYDRRKKYIHTIRIPRYIAVKGKKVEVVGGKDGFMEGLNGCVLEVPNTWKIHGVSLLDHAGESDTVEGVLCKIYEAREGYHEKPNIISKNQSSEVGLLIVKCLVWMLGLALVILSVKYWKWWTILTFFPIIASTFLVFMAIEEDDDTISSALIRILIWIACIGVFVVSILYLHWWTFIVAVPVLVLFSKKCVSM